MQNSADTILFLQNSADTILFLENSIMSPEFLSRNFTRNFHGGKSKNDRIDSHKIAALLRGGLVPMAYVYPRKMRATRDLMRRGFQYCVPGFPTGFPMSPDFLIVIFYSCQILLSSFRLIVCRSTCVTCCCGAQAEQRSSAPN